MQIETTAAPPSAALLDRLAAHPATAPTDHALRHSQLDGPDAIASDRRDRDRAAHMLLHLDDPTQVLRLGIDHLAHELRTPRADAGLVDEREAQYVPGVVGADSGGERRAIATTPLPNHHPVLRQVWTAPGSVSFDRVRGNRHLGTLEPVFNGLGTTAMLASPIRHRGVGLGLLCLDESSGRRAFTATEHRRVDRFVDRHLAPLLDASLRRHARRRVRLSAAETDAVRLLADGNSYAEIARMLGKSVRTIDNQLRAARSKAGVHNAIDLLRWWKDAHITEETTHAD